MKKTRYIIALVAAMFAVGAMLFVACEKEETSDRLSSLDDFSKNSSTIVNENNPYDYCGRIHNEILDYIINNNPSPTNEDVFNLTQEFLQKHYNIASEITFEDVDKGYSETTDFIIDAIINEASFKEINYSELVAGALDVLVDYSNAIIESNTLPVPQEYAEYLIEQEDQIVNQRNADGIPFDEVSEYDVALGMYAIARYSYLYWYEVANHPENAWNYVENGSKRHDDDPGFFKKLWNGLCNAVEVVVKVAVTPVVDAAGFVWGANLHNIPVPTTSSLINISPNFLSEWWESGLSTAGDWSGDVWE